MTTEKSNPGTSSARAGISGAWLERLPARPSHGDWDLFLLNCHAPVSPPDQWVVCSRQHLAAAYILSRAGAEWLVSEFGLRLAESDHMLWVLQNRGRSFTRFPWLVIQAEGESTQGGGSHLFREAATHLAAAGVDVARYV